jgi:hypothetical protein
MAAKLLLAERAIEMRRSAIKRKLKVNSIAELLDLAITHRVQANLRQVDTLDADTRSPNGDA